MQSRFFTIREQWLLLAVALAIVIGAGTMLWRGNDPARAADVFTPRTDAAVQASVISTVPAALSAPDDTVPAVSVAPTPPPPPERVGVGVLGAVKEEGLYFLPAGARIADLLEVAGGVSPDGDLSNINRTARLIDQTTLLVPRLVMHMGEAYSDPPVTFNPEPYTRSTWYRFGKSDTGAGASRTAAGSAGASSDRVNINTATQGELESLPGIGPVTAAKIIAHRQRTPFGNIADLQNVSGIGPAKMAAVRDLIAVD